MSLYGLVLYEAADVHSNYMDGEGYDVLFTIFSTYAPKKALAKTSMENINDLQLPEIDSLRVLTFRVYQHKTPPHRVVWYNNELVQYVSIYRMLGVACIVTSQISITVEVVLGKRDMLEVRRTRIDILTTRSRQS